MIRVRSEGKVLAQLQQVARENSGGDPVVEEILLMNLSYNWGKGINPRTPQIDEPSVVAGVKFWRVGHNASHEFYAGTNGSGKRFRRSVGENLTLDWEGKPLVIDETGFPTESPGLDDRVAEVAEFNGYIGHY